MGEQSLIGPGWPQVHIHVQWIKGHSWPRGTKGAVHFLIDDDVHCMAANSVPGTIDDFWGSTTIPGPIFCRLLVMSLSSGASPSLTILSPLLCSGPRVTFLLSTWLSSPNTYT